MIKFRRVGDTRRQVPVLAHPVEFDQLYEEHVDFVWRVLRRQGVPDMSIEDAVQDVFLVLHRKLASFEGRSSLRTFIYAVTRRVAFRHRRSQSRVERKLQALSHSPSEQAGLEHRVVLRQAARLLEDFLAELDDLKREAFVLGALEGFTRVELGAALGVSPNTAYSRLRAAREAFETRFGPSTSDPAAALLDGARLANTPVASERDRVKVAVFAILPQAAAATAGLTVKLALATILVAATTTIAIASTGVSEPRPESVAGREMPGLRPATDLPAGPAAEPIPIRAPSLADVEEHPPTPPPAATAHPRSTQGVDRKTPNTAVADAASALAEETRLMERVRRALAQREHDAALDLLDLHERKFTNGVLVVERKASRIVALCGLGRQAQARGEGRRFLAEHPTHPLTEVIVRTCSSIDFSHAGDQPDR